MQSATLNHNLDFVARFKPIAAPDQHRHLMIDLNGIPRDDVSHVQQALTELGLHFHILRGKEQAALYFDKAAYDMLNQYRQGAVIAAKNADNHISVGFIG